MRGLARSLAQREPALGDLHLRTEPARPSVCISLTPAARRPYGSLGRAGLRARAEIDGRIGRAIPGCQPPSKRPDDQILLHGPSVEGDADQRFRERGSLGRGDVAFVPRIGADRSSAGRRLGVRGHGRSSLRPDDGSRLVAMRSMRDGHDHRPPLTCAAAYGET